MCVCVHVRMRMDVVMCSECVQKHVGSTITGICCYVIVIHEHTINMISWHGSSTSIMITDSFNPGQGLRFCEHKLHSYASHSEVI